MSAVLRPTRPERLPVYPREASEGRAPAWWGMVLLIFTEATFFAILLLSYFYIRFQTGVTWPPPPIEKPSLALVSIMTPILLLSSVPAHLADMAMRKGDLRRLRLGIAMTMLQGGTFIGLQCVEYLDLTKHFQPWTNAYGSLFFTITGFHGLHVAIGLVMLSWVLVYSFRGRWTRRSHVPVQNVILYWHFVDAVWLFIFTSLYISPHWWP